VIEFKYLEDLGATHWKTPERYDFLGSFPYVPLSDTELLLRAHHFPIVILDADNGPEVVAVLEPMFQRTQLVDARGRWQRSYVPIALRTLPFRLDHQPELEPRLQAASNLGLVGDKGQPFFQADGSPSRQLNAVRALLTTLQTGRERLSLAAERLILTDLLSPLTGPSGRPPSPSLLTIEATHFQRLAGRRAAALISERILELDLAMACFFSQRNFNDAVTWQPDLSPSAELSPPVMEVMIKGLEDLPVTLDSSELFSIDLLKTE
jgi:hypothetical protein